MRVRIQKWGHGLALRIPESIAVETRIERDTLVDLSLVEGKLVISPVACARPTLEQLLEGVTPENLHNEWETGPAAGVEAW